MTGAVSGSQQRSGLPLVRRPQGSSGRRQRQQALRIVSSARLVQSGGRRPLSGLLGIPMMDDVSRAAAAAGAAGVPVQAVTARGPAATPRPNDVSLHGGGYHRELLRSEAKMSEQ